MSNLIFKIPIVKAIQFDIFVHWITKMILTKTLCALSHAYEQGICIGIIGLIRQAWQAQTEQHNGCKE